MQPRVTQVGPLVVGSTTKIALSQTAPAAGYLALNGAAGDSTANNICLSQSGTAATPLLINGALKQTLYVNPIGGFTAPTIAMLPNTGSPITITSAGDDHLITFRIVGKPYSPQSGAAANISETVTGSNASVVASANSYQSIISITPSGNTASTVTVGAMGFATLDVARQVLITSGASDAGITFTITGGDWAGSPISEVLTGGAATAVSVNDYLTINSIQASGATASTVTVGTNGVAGSPWVNLDAWANGPMFGQCSVSGTVSYTVQTTNDDPDSYANPIARSLVVWDSALVNVATQTGLKSFTLPASPAWIRVVLASQTNPGFVRMTIAQSGAVSY